jgi:inosine-uridine nucleoside N-ribohydrolase
MPHTALLNLLLPCALSIATVALVCGQPHPPGQPSGGFIFDTDTAMLVNGLDIDDDLAAIFLTAAGAPILGITSAFGNDVQEETHKDVLQLLDLMPQQPARAYRGAEVFDPRAATNASAFMVETLRASAGNVTVLCVGAMSNLAAALATDPSLAAKIGSLVLLGGDLDAPANASLFYTIETNANYYFDLEGTAQLINLTRSVPTVVMPIQVMVRAAVTEDVVARLGACPPGSLVMRPALQAKIAEWQTNHAPRMNRTFGHLPGFAPGGFFPWDVHAAALATAPDLYGDFGWFSMDVVKESGGSSTTSTGQGMSTGPGRSASTSAAPGLPRVVFREVQPGQSNVRAPRSLDSAGFVDLLVERLCAV